MPAERKPVFRNGIERQDIKLAFAEFKRAFDRFSQACPGLISYRDAILDHGNQARQTFHRFGLVRANDRPVQPNAQETLLVQK